MSDKKLTIINPNLKNIAGHYFEYISSLIEPSRRKGYQVEVLAHKAIAEQLTRAFPVVKAFEREIWQQMPLLPRLSRYGRRCGVIIENVRFYRALCSVLKV